MIASELDRACIVIVEINSKSCSGRQSWTRLGEAQARFIWTDVAYAFTIELDNVMTIMTKRIRATHAQIIVLLPCGRAC